MRQHRLIIRVDEMEKSCHEFANTKYFAELATHIVVCFAYLPEVQCTLLAIAFTNYTNHLKIYGLNTYLIQRT